jgi:ABC-type nitrate/sulfonate/bicarbonate transport system substrate-binding protein
MIAAGFQVNPVAYFTLDPTIKTPKDWEGKRVAVNVGPSYVEYQVVCETAGVNRSKITEITTDYAQYTTMAAGRVDVTTGTYLADMYAIEKMGYPNGTKSWYIMPSNYGINVHTSCISVRTDWLKDPKNYDLAQRFITVTQRAFEWSFTHFGEAQDIFLHYNPDVNKIDEYNLGWISITVNCNTTEVWQHGWGWIQQSVIEQNEASFFKYNLTSTRVNVTEGSTWTNALVNAAYKANHPK